MDMPALNQSDPCNELYAALIQAQAVFKPVPKTQTAKVRSQRTNSEYTYKYADLSDVMSMALPILAKHDVGLMQPLIRTESGLRVFTRLIHKSGQWLMSDGLAISENVAPQELGTEITYFRRYDACALLGIVADEDTDGPPMQDRESKPKIQQPKEKQAPTEGEKVMAERAKVVAEIKELIPDSQELGRRAKELFPTHKDTSSLLLSDLQRMRDIFKQEREKPLPLDIPADVAALFDEGVVTTANKLPPVQLIGRPMAQRFHRLMGVRKIHTEAELEEQILKPRGVGHVSDLPMPIYEALLEWADGKRTTESMDGL